MNKTELEILLKYYDTARQEILIRISARDNTLLVFLGAVAAIIGASFQVNNNLLLIVIPYISLGISLIISNHHTSIASLAAYCSKELGDILHKNDILIPQWETSAIRSEFSSKTFKIRYLGDFIIISVPSIFGLIMINPNTNYQTPFMIIYVFSWICFFTSTITLFYAYRLTQKLRNKRSLKSK